MTLILPFFYLIAGFGGLFPAKTEPIHLLAPPPPHFFISRVENIFLPSLFHNVKKISAKMSNLTKALIRPAMKRRRCFVRNFLKTAFIDGFVAADVL